MIGDRQPATAYRPPATVHRSLALSFALRPLALRSLLLAAFQPPRLPKATHLAHFTACP
jgi:hypothetical protein